MAAEIPVSVNLPGESIDTVRPAPERSRWRAVLLWVVPAIIVAIAVYLYGSAGRYVSTGNAYVQQDRVNVVPQISADVLQVFVDENARVKAGQKILKLDDQLTRVAIQGAEAQLAAARANVESLKAACREKQGELAVARKTADYAVRDYERQRALLKRNLVAQAAVDAAHRSADFAVGGIAVLKLQLAQAVARLGGDANQPTDQNPTVLAAAADLERLRVDLGHTVVLAPQAGIVSHLPKVGDRAVVGLNAFAIVVDRALWVEANFKETDLEFVRPGQPVSVEVDTYGRRRWHGRVESISQATGAEFSLLPPQNASGNWVKVVQRIPVRIALSTTPDDPPLRDGMSADVKIDTGPHSRFSRWFGSTG
ncbi:MAG: HlyD family secretion protein [Gammaproteobacteria bacterium]